jgi:hypothetical protein
MRPLPRSEDFAIRPTIRVFGTLLMLFLAYVSVEIAMPLFQAEAIAAKSCERRGKGWWVCELTNLLWAYVPPSVQGEIAGTSGLLAAAFWTYFAWLLLKPVLQRAR